MRLGILLGLLFACSSSMAVTYNCEVEKDSDAYMRISLLKDGSVEFQQHEFFTSVPAKQVTLQSATSNEGVGQDTHLTLVNNVLADYSVEGEEGKALTTIVFIYNPSQKAGRLTFIQDGRAAARNRLFSNCSDQ